MPYAVKPKIEHNFVDNALSVYLTFRNKMKISSDPLADPPPIDIMPPLDLWTLSVDGNPVVIIGSIWLDNWTLLLSSDEVTQRPLLVMLSYTDPNIGLRTAWDKQWEPFGPFPSSEIVSAVLSNFYPQRATMWQHEANYLTEFPPTTEVNASCLFYTRTYHHPPLNGDTFTHSFFLKAGTYNFNVIGGAQTQYGLLDWYVDDVKIVSLQDWYAASVNYNVIKTTSDVIITTDGYHQLKAVVNGKNPASSSYYIALIKCWFAPATDPVRA